MNTEIKFSDEAKSALKEGVDLVAEAVKVSLGAEGRNMIIPRRQGGFDITKDGISIAQTVLPADIFTAIGASLIKEAAGRTNIQAGDGTTTATVLAQAIFNEGLKLVEAGASPVELKKGIDMAVEDIVEGLEKLSEKVTDENLIDVATISANGDSELGELIAASFNKIGEHGVVLTEESHNKETYVELREGVQLDRGYTHPVFATNTVKGVCEIEEPLVLLHRGKIERSDKFLDMLKTLYDPKNGGNNSLLIITDDMDPFVFSVIMENVRQGNIGNGKMCVIKTPQILKIEKSLMDDLAVLTGATIVDRLAGTVVQPSSLGRLKRAVVTDRDATLVGNSDNLAGLIEELKAKIKNTDNQFDKKELQERLSRITGGVATLYVASKSDSELREKLDRVEDSINATRSALEEGIVAGAGKALIDVVKTLGKKEFANDSIAQGYSLVTKSTKVPFEQILINGGVENPKAPAKKGFGINVSTMETVDLKKAGIIDPKKVTRCALENAASVAGTFLTTEGVIAPVDVQIVG